MCAFNNAKLREQMWGVRWTCIHVLMHLPKVWNQQRGHLDTYEGPQRGRHVCMKQWKGGGAGMGNKVDMNSYTDACMHSNQCVDPAEGMGWTHTWDKTGMHICAQISRGWSR